MPNIYEIYITSSLLGVLYACVMIFSGIGAKGLKGSAKIHGGKMHTAKINNAKMHNAKINNAKMHTAKSTSIKTEASNQSSSATNDNTQNIIVSPTENRQNNHFILNSLANIIFFIFNPMRIALFMLGFGFTGLIYLSLDPKALTFSLIAAVISGILLNQALSGMLNWMSENMNTNSLTPTQELIGLTGKVTVPISGNSIGEISYTAGGIKYFKRAKIADGSSHIDKFSKVLICAIENDILLVSSDMEYFSKLS